MKYDDIEVGKKYTHPRGEITVLCKDNECKDVWYKLFGYPPSTASEQEYVVWKKIPEKKPDTNLKYIYVDQDGAICHGLTIAHIMDRSKEYAPYRAIMALDPAQNMKPVPFDPFYIDKDGKVVMD